MYCTIQVVSVVISSIQNNEVTHSSTDYSFVDGDPPSTMLGARKERVERVVRSEVDANSDKPGGVDLLCLSYLNLRLVVLVVLVVGNHSNDSPVVTIVAPSHPLTPR